MNSVVVATAAAKEKNFGHDKLCDDDHLPIGDSYTHANLRSRDFHPGNFQYGPVLYFDEEP
jgi:hypothetical protein